VTPPAVPRPAASVLLVRPGAGPGVEVYMIRRQKTMRFLGGFYAFPGGRVDEADAGADVLARCRGVTAEEAARVVPRLDGLEPLAFWVTAARELLEETGILCARRADGTPVSGLEAGVAERIERARQALAAERASLAGLLAAEGWYLDLSGFRYLSHFITPPSSPIRFTARFFLAPVPAGQAPRLVGGEASEGFWIDPKLGYGRFRSGEMAMAEPADCGLAYLSEFATLDDIWAAHADRRHKFHGILDRVEAAGVEVRRGRRPAAG
jgi:8-oxo-dGTP pyrophosphatase MutT (NUDIX family)